MFVRFISQDFKFSEFPYGINTGEPGLRSTYSANLLLLLLVRLLER